MVSGILVKQCKTEMPKWKGHRYEKGGGYGKKSCFEKRGEKDSDAQIRNKESSQWIMNRNMVGRKIRCQGPELNKTKSDRKLKFEM